MIPNREFYLLFLGHIYTESKKYSDPHHAGIVPKGVYFVVPGAALGTNKSDELKYEVFKALP